MPIIKSLKHFSFDVLLHLTIRHSNKIFVSKSVWFYIFEIWEFISLLPWAKTSLYYKILSKFAHSLSHFSKLHQVTSHGFPMLTTDEVFMLLITCQSPKLVFDYKFKRERLLTSKILPMIDLPIYSHYFRESLNELDLSGADMCNEDSLLIALLPKCQSLKILCLGHAASPNVLSAAKNCPLKKLQLEERFPHHPKLSQETVIKHILGYTGEMSHLNTLLEMCRDIDYIKEADELTEENHQAKVTRRQYLERFIKHCEPVWPSMKILILGNCKISREAVVLCLLVLDSLEEISLHRIQSDEIINTCKRVFSLCSVNYSLSINHLTLWGGWTGFRTNILQLVPKVKSLCLIAYGYSDLSLQQTVEINPALSNVVSLCFVGLRHAGQSIFKRTNPFLTKISTLELSGVIISSDEFVNIMLCLPNLTTLKLDYTEMRCYNNNTPIAEDKLGKNSLLELYIDTSYIDLGFIKEIFKIARKVMYLRIRGRTVNFSLSFAHQRVFLNNADLHVNYIELYPQYPLDVPGLIHFAKSRKEAEQIYLHIPLKSITPQENLLLRNNGWTIIPACHRC